MILRALAPLLILLLAGCEARQLQETPAAGAVRNNDYQALTAYLAQGGNPNAESRDGDALLYLASGPRGGHAVLAVLLEAGADVNKGARNGRTALMNAAGWCDAQMVVMLLGAGADARALGPENKTARDSVCSGPLDRRQAVLAIFDAAGS